MKFEAKQIPEGINTSPHHPLKELFILLAGISLLLVLAFVLLMLLSDFLVRYIPLETEQKWFTEKRLDFVRSTPLTEEKREVEKYLAHLVKQLQASQTDTFRYSIRLVESDVPNAFITPGGHIFVTTELLRHVNSENALSMVIAHEMAHQVHRHPIRSMGRGVVIAVALMMFSGVDGSEWVTDILAKSINLGLLAYSREQERDADATGLGLLVDHYGHSAGSHYFFSQLRKLEKPGDKALNRYLDTHPAIEQRVDYLRRFDPDREHPLRPLDDSVQRLLDSITESGESAVQPAQS